MSSIEAFANPEVIAWARRMAGLGLEDAAHKACVTPECLGAWEEGRLRPTIMQLRRLSDIYKRPLALFFLDKPPADEPAPSDFRCFDSDTARPLTPELRLAIRDARARRKAALELLEELNEKPPVFELRATLSDNPETVGMRLRELLTAAVPPPGGDMRRPFNFWWTAAERAGVLVFQAEDVDVEEMRGFSISERPLPAVVLNIRDACAGRSFSLLHGLAHIGLNCGGLCLFEEGGPQTDIQRTEVFCNHVAGAALLPARSLLRRPETPGQRVPSMPDEAITAIAERYGASAEAVLRRLVSLNRVSRDFYQRKRAEYAKQYEKPRQQQGQAGGFPSRAMLAVARGGRLFTRLVLEAFDEERITANDVAELLGERLNHLDEIRAAIEQLSEFGT